MKSVYFIFTVLLAVSDCYHFPVITSPQYSVPVLNIRGINESILFVTENNTDDMLINSLLLGLYPEQSVTMIRGKGFRVAKKEEQNKDPNIVILAETININTVQTAPFHIILRSLWSTVHFVITAKTEHTTCENGVFNTSFIENAQKYLNEIWHRFRITRIVVSFPYTCPYHYIIYSGTKPSKRAVFDRTIKIITAKNKRELKEAILANSKLRDLTVGYPLKTKMFYRFPTSLTKCDKIYNFKKINFNYSNGFCGMDALVMHDFMEHYRFNLTEPKDDSCDVYGFVKPGTNVVTGSLGCIIRQTMDISFNSRFMVQYTTEKFFYLHYITTDTLAVILRVPDEIPLWHYAYNCYGIRTALIICLIIMVVGVIMWATAWLTTEMTRQNPWKLRVYMLSAATSTLFGFSIIRKAEMFRILRGASLICSIILLSIYQGNINYQFTTRTRHREIKTLRQLYFSGNELYASPSIQSLILNVMNPDDKAQVDFLRRMHIKNETLGIGYVVDHEDAATIARGQDVLMEVLLNYTDNNGVPLMYVVEETFATFYVAFIARTGFLFVEESHIFMMRMLEAGLPKIYYMWTRHTLKLEDTYPKTGSSPRPTKKLQLENLRIAFYLLAFGCFISSLSFLFEMYRGRICNKKCNKKYVVTL